MDIFTSIFSKNHLIKLLMLFCIVAFSFESVRGQTYTFTNAGATGQFGPTQSQISAAYTGSNLAGQVTSNGGIQFWVVPATGIYKIEALGSSGGGVSGGFGATMEGEFILNAGDTILIIVGQSGIDGLDGSASGGGGTFVVKRDATSSITMSNGRPVTPLLIAGGGGANPGVVHVDANANTGTSGKSGNGVDGSGAGGTNGNGGSIAVPNGNNRGGGGGGFLTDGDRTGTCTTNGEESGSSFLNGGAGGKSNSCGTNQVAGGFGGGGGAISTGWRSSGGGGGYSGGGGGQTNSNATTHRGGGGGSFSSGANTISSIATTTGHGLVVISSLSTGAPNDAGIIAVPEPNIYCPGTHNILATVQNFGSNQISSVNINWTIDGVAQTPYSFTGTLDTMGGTGSATSLITLGSFNFTNAPHTIKVWTTMPNNTADTVNMNDTIFVTKQSSLPPPTGITTTTVLGTQATFSWTGGSNNSWLYSNVPFGTPVTGVGTATTTPTATITNLTGETTYDFYVREVCPGGDTSVWAGPYTYTTPFYCPPGANCFTTCGEIGRTGPSQAQCDAAYAGTSLQGNVTLSAGIQNWIVPVTGIYQIEAYGAQGSNATITTGGLGAYISGQFLLNQGDTLRILVGQNAPNTVGRENLSSSGGGGTFITKSPHNTKASILVIAGGGGGTGNERPATSNATIDSTGQTGSHGTGGINGNGGTAGTSSAGAGAGFFTDGVGGGGAGVAYVNGGFGGPVNTAYSVNGGGFGGGGSITGGGNSRYGGGGGYSGGSGSNSSSGATSGLWGGGGASYNNGLNQTNTPAVRFGNGVVIITPLGATYLDAQLLSVAPTTQQLCATTGTVPVEAIVRSNSTNTIYNVGITAELTGATTGTFTQTLDSMQVGSVKTVSFTNIDRSVVGSTTIKVYVAFANDANQTNDTLINTYTIDPIPALPVSSDEVACNGQTATFVASAPGSVINWYSIPTGGSSIATGDTFTTGILNTTTTYYVEAEAMGCPSGRVPVEVFVSQLSVNPGSSDTVCHNVTMNLGGAPTATGSNGPFTYQWSPAGGLSSATIANPVFTPGATTLYTLSVTDNMGCIRTSTVGVTVSQEMQMNEVIKSPCPGETSGEINLGLTGGIAPYTYSWSTGSAFPFVWGAAPGSYSITVTDLAGCQAIESFTVNPADTILASGQVTNMTSYATPNGAVTLNVTGGSGGYTYKWSNGETTKDISGLTDGTYTVEITDGNGCSRSFTFTVQNTVGIDDENVFSNLNIYPNPAGNRFTVDITSDNKQSVIIEVFDMVGRRIYASEKLSATTISHKINSDSWQQGQYLIKISSDGRSVYRKIDIIR